MNNERFEFLFKLYNQKMKGQNFLLGFLGKQEPTTIKSKNPNTNSKLIKEKPSLLIEKKQIDQKSSLRSSQKDFKKAEKPSVVDEIQKLQKRLQATNEQISQTQKKLDVDLFLKQQKQKRMQYAKDINKEYEIQKKKREQKLYKKYNRGDEGNNQEGENEQNLEQTKNVKTSFPLELIKILQTQKNSISKSESIVANHHFSLDNIESQGKMISYEKMCEQEREIFLFKKSADDKENSANISVMSLRKIAQNMLNVSYFPINFSQPHLDPAEEYQNLMNALTLMPQHLQQRYYSSRIMDEKIYFLCKMFYNGQRKSIITTDLIETRQFAHYHINLHSKMTDNRSFGPTIVEKCYRKVSANLKYPNLASCVYTLYGTDAEIITIGNMNYIKDNFETVLKWLIDSKQLVGFMNCDGHNEGIYQNRLYQLKEIVETVDLSEEQQPEEKKKKKKDQHQQQKNPPMTTTQNLKKTLYHFSNPYKGLLLDTKSINKFQILEVLQKFNTIILIRDLPRTWSCKRINLQLFSLGPLSMTSNQWTKNNQYNFTIISSATNLRIVMRKLTSSSAQSIMNRQVTKEQDMQTNSLYGFMIFHCKQGEQKITCMKLDSLVVKTKSNDSLEYPSFTSKFNKGNYIIIPYSNKITKTTYQYFHLDFLIQKDDNVKFGKAVVNQWKWTKLNNNSHSQKIIQSLQTKQYVQKTKTQDVEINRISPNNINPQKLLNAIDKDKLLIPKNSVFNDLLIPGKLTNFLVNPEIQETTTKNIKLNSKSKTLQKTFKKQPQNTKNDQIQSLQKEQALHILLGYDFLQGEEVNRGLMMEEIQSNEQVFDFQHYGLGNEYIYHYCSGLTAIMQTLMQYPCIRKLNLADNDLDVSLTYHRKDSAIVYLCYYLDKGNRVELKELNVSDNNFGKIGMDSIKGLMTRFQKLHVTY